MSDQNDSLPHAHRNSHKDSQPQDSRVSQSSAPAPAPTLAPTPTPAPTPTLAEESASRSAASHDEPHGGNADEALVPNVEKDENSQNAMNEAKEENGKNTENTTENHQDPSTAKKKGWFARGADDAVLQEKITTLEQDILYAKAEAQNIRRRAEKDIADARVYAVTAFARDMVQIADNLARALESVSEQQRQDPALQSLLTGIAATERELKAIFERYGIKPVAAMGLPLDPNLHQAMFEVPSTDVAPGMIVQEMQLGYVIKDRLLRPSLVGVAKAPEEPSHS